MRKKSIPAASSFFRQMIDLVPHFIFAKDAEGRYILANEAVAKAYGISAERICQLCDADFAPNAEEAAGFRRDDLEVLRSGKIKYINEVITDCDGNVRDLMTTKVPFDSPETGPGVLGICIDVTERNAALRKIAYLAEHCHLTGLPNRSQLSVFLEEPIQNGESCALLFVDLDQFKQINDSLGHCVGDVFLQLISARFEQARDPKDFVCRLGGDEFIFVLRNTSTDAVSAFSSELLRIVAEPVAINGMTLMITCSIGVAQSPEHGTAEDVLMKHADAALYKAKKLGRNAFQWYTEELQHAADRRLFVYNELQAAVRNGELELLVQPIVDAQSGVYGSAEALLRWHSRERGLISPDEFIPLAEESGLIRVIGNWVIEEACRMQRAWLDRGIDFHLSVNLSAQQLLEPGFEHYFRETCSAAGVPLEKIGLEITEGVLLGDVEAACGVLSSLSDSGVTVSVDDFGVGYSSLSYLRRLPLSILKIDRSFVKDCVENPDDATLVRTIIMLAKNLKLQVVAEGVETEAQVNFLCSEGVDFFQGYLFAKPMLAGDVAVHLEESALR
ncbi:diguanylate cyclase/phosphodiesterase [Nitrosomonas sp. Nm84]|uniref:putative bifunctional diguanylate cyclase/phosphodiesterase n=1 Tax=Nitrosomonas sp. Nm84 TaxID=200124 RepID=UPI000D75A725|nr:GGDEF and EAL domain-containing protein [Nitrosomonas sp. Nm84]PXW86060.1 diguanylate cyclase/phosphodiesterase [Nitrosomonas sp. Nm84]